MPIAAIYVAPGGMKKLIKTDIKTADIIKAKLRHTSLTIKR